MQIELAPDAKIAALATRQHGLVHRRQLLALGLSPQAINHRLRAGRLHRVFRAVYAVGHRRLTTQGRWLAAVLACSEHAVLSHHSAAAAWGLRTTAATRVNVSTTNRAGRRAPAAIRIHRPVALAARDVTVLDEIPVTTPTQTLIALAARLPRRPFERTLDEADAHRLLDRPRLGAFAATTAPGSRLVRTVLDAHRDPALTRSVLEERFLALLGAHGLPLPLMNTRIDGFEVDAHWPATDVGVELDSRRHHHTDDAFQRDRTKGNALVRRGRRVLRFTWHDVVAAPEQTARTMAELLARAPPAGARDQGRPIGSRAAGPHD